MSGLLKAVRLTLSLGALGALAVLCILIGSCGSNAPANIRFVDALQDAPAMDIDITGTDTNNVQKFTDIAFLGVQPNQPGYTSVPSGSDTVKGVVTGTTTQVFTDNVGWSSVTNYSVIATGFSQTGTNGSNVVVLSIPDNIPTPPDGDVAFRVIHASPSGPGSVDVYIELNPNTGPGLPITIQGLNYTQASKYVFFAFNPNNETIPPGYTVYVTASGSLQPIISELIAPSTTGAVRTLVLTDVQNGKTMNSSFLELSDAN
jgi:hypothetical protein